MSDIVTKFNSVIGNNSKQLTFGVDRILSNEIYSKKAGIIYHYFNYLLIL